MKGKERESTTTSVKHGGGIGIAWTCMAPKGTGSLVFIDEVTDDRRRRRRNSGMWRAMLSALIRPNYAKLIELTLTEQMVKATKEFLKAKKIEYFSLARSVTFSQPN